MMTWGVMWACHHPCHQLHLIPEGHCCCPAVGSLLLVGCWVWSGTPCLRRCAAAWREPQRAPPVEELMLQSSSTDPQRGREEGRAGEGAALLPLLPTTTSRLPLLHWPLHPPPPPLVPTAAGAAALPPPLPLLLPYCSVPPARRHHHLLQWAHHHHHHLAALCGCGVGRWPPWLHCTQKHSAQAVAAPG